MILLGAIAGAGAKLEAGAGAGANLGAGAKLGAGAGAKLGAKLGEGAGAALGTSKVQSQGQVSPECTYTQLAVVPIKALKMLPPARPQPAGCWL